MQLFSLDERKRELNVCRKYDLGSNSRKETRKISFEKQLKKHEGGRRIRALVSFSLTAQSPTTSVTSFLWLIPHLLQGTAMEQWFGGGSTKVPGVRLPEQETELCHQQPPTHIHLAAATTRAQQNPLQVVDDLGIFSKNTTIAFYFLFNELFNFFQCSAQSF